MAAAAVMDQCHRLLALMDGDLFGIGAVAQGIEHGVTGAIGSVAGAPFFGTTKVTGGDQAMGLIGGRQGLALAIDYDIMVAPGDTVPGDAPGSKFPYRFGCHVGKQAGNLLVATPVTTTNGVLEVDIFVIAHPFDAIAQACLHATLGSYRVRAFGWHQREYQRL